MSMWFNPKERITNQLRHDYEYAFGSPEGERVLRDIIVSSNILTPAVDMETNHIVFREGERSVALRILKILQTGPEEIQTIIEEEIEDAGSGR